MGSLIMYSQSLLISQPDKLTWTNQRYGWYHHPAGMGCTYIWKAFVKHHFKMIMVHNIRQQLHEITQKQNIYTSYAWVKQVRFQPFFKCRYQRDGSAHWNRQSAPKASRGALRQNALSTVDSKYLLNTLFKIFIGWRYHMGVYCILKQ